jgi:hypothetical protein
VPLVVPAFFALAPVRRFMFRTMSQTAVSYRGSSLSEGRAGTVHGGDRLPWVKLNVKGVDQDNFTPLRSLDWQVHVYGDAAPELQAVCQGRALPLHIFPWSSQASRTGLRRDAVYLVRPDGYVGLVAPDGSVTAVTSYLDARKLTTMRRPPSRSEPATPMSTG